MDKTDDTRDFYTVPELAELAGISDARVRQILLDGRQLRGSKVGQSWIVGRSEAVRWLAERKRDN